jgi:hypothetical protein
VLVLDEMPPGESASTIRKGLPEVCGPWHVLNGTGGGPHQRVAIAARWPIRRAPQFDELTYPRRFFGAWLAVEPPANRARTRQALQAGVPTLGGVVRVGRRRLLVVGLDLQCCGDGPDSPQELRRRFEARAVRGAIDRTLASRRLDGILVGGDFNTVAGGAPLVAMQYGAAAGPPLSIVQARHRDGRAAWTWDGRGTPYASARLDYALHSDALLPLQAQVFDSEGLSPQSRARLHLEAGLSRSLSPHRPIVVDFGWRDRLDGPEDSAFRRAAGQ